MSTPSELQAAIDGNRREGRRSSYGQFDSQIQGQISQIQQQMQRSPIPGGLQQMSPLSLVTHGAGGVHNRLPGLPQMGQMPNIMSHDIEQRMIDYIKMIQNTKEARSKTITDIINSDIMQLLPKEHQLTLINMIISSGSQSPDLLSRNDAFNALEMSRVALWSMYNNNTSPPNSINTTSPPNLLDTQR